TAVHVSGRLAHDFGNVLTGILGFAELSLPHLVPGAVPHRFVTEIWQAAQQGADWVRKLQYFGRRGPTPPALCGLAPLVTEELPRWRAACGPAAALQVAVPADLPAVALDPDSLRQLLGQLLDNPRD